MTALLLPIALTACDDSEGPDNGKDTSDDDGGDGGDDGADDGGDGADDGGGDGDGGGDDAAAGTRWDCDCEADCDGEIIDEEYTGLCAPDRDLATDIVLDECVDYWLAECSEVTCSCQCEEDGASSCG